MTSQDNTPGYANQTVGAKEIRLLHLQSHPTCLELWLPSGVWAPRAGGHKRDVGKGGLAPPPPLLHALSQAFSLLRGHSAHQGHFKWLLKPLLSLNGGSPQRCPVGEQPGPLEPQQPQPLLRRAGRGWEGTEEGLGDSRLPQKMESWRGSQGQLQRADRVHPNVQGAQALVTATMLPEQEARGSEKPCGHTSTPTPRPCVLTKDPKVPCVHHVCPLMAVVSWSG